jgi:carboxyl-terminal processing protease
VRARAGDNERDVSIPRSRNRPLAFLLGAALVSVPLAARPAPATPDVTLVDLIELEIGYTTILYHYYWPVAQQRLLDGARTGIVAYLRSRGISDPQVAYMHARSDGRGAVPAIERELGKAVQRYGARVNVRQLVYATIDGELSSLHDPYSVLFTKAELKGFETAINGETFGGIGMIAAYDDAVKQWHADQVFAGGPAQKAGLEPGDVLLAVDGKPAGALDADGLGALLRGKIGTVVRVSIERDGKPLPGPVSIVRAQVTPPEVTARMLPGDVGYVALRTFGEKAGDGVRDAVRSLEAKGAKALVLDLRGNGGGYESAAVKVASVFINGGTVVSNVSNGGKRVVQKAAGDALPALPLAVLVDRDSASGSELTAAALQDAHAAMLVGTRTFGKGVAQEMFPLPDGSAMKLTTSRYYTPAGRDIDKIGLTPDITVEQTSGAQTGVVGHDPQLDRALQALSSSRGSNPRL